MRPIQDEQSGDTDPIPSFLRAKKLLAANWDMIEEVNGSREKTLESIFRFGKMVRLLPAYIRVFWHIICHTKCQIMV